MFYKLRVAARKVWVEKFNTTSGIGGVSHYPDRLFQERNLRPLCLLFLILVEKFWSRVFPDALLCSRVFIAFRLLSSVSRCDSVKSFTMRTELLKEIASY